MADEHESRKLFSEKQVSTILRRATEMQQAAKTTDPTGLTFEELQQIAAEAGIDPKYLGAAITEQEQQGDVDERFRWLGASTSVEKEHVIVGEVSEEQWEVMVDEIRRAFKLVGASGQIGRSREWTHDSRDQQAQVTVTSRDGQTKIRLVARYPQLAVATFVPATTLAFGFGGILANILGFDTFFPVLPIMAAFTGMIFLLLRFLFSRMMRKKEREAEQLIARLEEIVAAPTQEAAPALPEQTARLDASLLDEATPEQAPAQTASRTKTSS